MKVDLDDIYTMIASTLDLDETEVNEIDGDEDLAQYGLESITSIQLVVMLEEKYNIVFDNDDLLMSKYNTINKLVKLLEKY